MHFVVIFLQVKVENILVLDLHLKRTPINLLHVSLHFSDLNFHTLYIYIYIYIYTADFLNDPWSSLSYVSIYVYIHVCVTTCVCVCVTCVCVCMSACVCVCICVRQTSIFTIGMEFIFYYCFLMGKPSTTKGKFYSMKVFVNWCFNSARHKRLEPH